MQVFVAIESDAVTYVVVREEDCILGGTAIRDDWDEAPRADTFQDIRRRCGELFPPSLEPALIEHRVGLRPGRDVVRLERGTLMDGRPVIHNYGHGGAGFTVGWGCASEVVRILADQ